ncbi:hypothetical protein GOL41_26980 [Sinorhizobium medicae]|nr:hypothetical protein [Sinorhizobium medicae]MDX1053360.1 hypothetical protein [Sinorhizobium medicae]
MSIGLHGARVRSLKNSLEPNHAETRAQTAKQPMIVALARKLLVALWKYVSCGVVMEGASQPIEIHSNPQG